jgi:hypothetical protein
MYQKHFFEKPVVSSISHIPIFSSAGTISLIFSTICSKLVIFGLPYRGGSCVLLQPFLKFTSHFLTVRYDGEECLNMESRSFLISGGVQTLKLKNPMTKRISSLFIFQDGRTVLSSKVHNLRTIS